MLRSFLHLEAIAISDFDTGLTHKFHGIQTLIFYCEEMVQGEKKYFPEDWMVCHRKYN